jgi:hypothetical protein
MNILSLPLGLAFVAGGGVLVRRASPGLSGKPYTAVILTRPDLIGTTKNLLFILQKADPSPASNGVSDPNPPS